jgi:hypothetical protein
VVEEYRRFVYLAMAAGHPVTPSVDVDHAWHLHLTYTRSYWEEMCGRVLGRPLHHDPTRGGLAEGAKFTDWYARTLRSYQEAFGSAPPADIWPSPAERFAPAAKKKHDGPAADGGASSDSTSSSCDSADASCGEGGGDGGGDEGGDGGGGCGGGCGGCGG